MPISNKHRLNSSRSWSGGVRHLLVQASVNSLRVFCEVLPSKAPGIPGASLRIAVLSLSDLGGTMRSLNASNNSFTILSTLRRFSA